MAIPAFIEKKINRDVSIERINDLIYGISDLVEKQKNDAKNKTKTLLVVTGISGSGKDSIVRGLENNDKRFLRVKTCTTRPRRPEENDENDTYVRLTDDMFRTAMQKGDIVESVEYAGNYYCSLKSIFKNAYDLCEIPILGLDPKGTRFYTEMWKRNEGIFETINLVSIFVVSPSIESLKERLLKRSNDIEFVEKRIKQMENDMRYITDAEYIVVNETDALEKTVEYVVKLF